MFQKYFIVCTIPISIFFTGCLNDSPKEEKSQLATSASYITQSSYWNNYQLPGLGNDVGANTLSGKNSMLVGQSPRSGGYSMFIRSGSFWWDEPGGGGAVRIAMAASRGWCVNNLGQAFKENASGNGWDYKPFNPGYQGNKILDIAGNKAGAVVVSVKEQISSTGYEFNVYFQSSTQTTWSRYAYDMKSAAKVAVDDNNITYVQTTDGKFYSLENGISDRGYGWDINSMTDISAVGNGVVFYVEGGGNGNDGWIWKFNTKTGERSRLLDKDKNVILGLNVSALNENEIWYTKANGQIWRAYI